VLEALAQLAPPAPVTTLRQHKSATRLSEARTCYDHLAGRRGVELRDRLLATGALMAIDDRDHVLTDSGRDLVAALGLEPVRLERSRRVFARSCVDWTLRRPHLAGALPAAITERFLALGWLARAGDRSLRVHTDYDLHLNEWLLATSAAEGQG
jgi:hypothetical protein